MDIVTRLFGPEPFLVPIGLPAFLETNGKGSVDIDELLDFASDPCRGCKGEEKTGQVIVIKEEPCSCGGCGGEDTSTSLWVWCMECLWQAEAHRETGCTEPGCGTIKDVFYL